MATSVLCTCLFFFLLFVQCLMLGIIKSTSAAICNKMSFAYGKARGNTTMPKFAFLYLNIEGVENCSVVCHLYQVFVLDKKQ